MDGPTKRPDVRRIAQWSTYCDHPMRSPPVVERIDRQPLHFALLDDRPSLLASVSVIFRQPSEMPLCGHVRAISLIVEHHRSASHAGASAPLHRRNNQRNVFPERNATSFGFKLKALRGRKPWA